MPLEKQRTDRAKVVEALDLILVMHLIWSVLRWQLDLPGLANGIGIFLFPVVEVVAIIYCLARTDIRFMTPYVFIPVAFHVYMIARHCFNGDIMSHGASGFYTLAFCLFCMPALKKEELAKRFHVFCLAMFWLSVAVSLLSYISLVFPITDAPTQGGRLQGIMPHPNTLGHSATYGLVFGIGAFLLVPSSRAFLAAIVVDALLTVKVLIDSQSRASMLFLAFTFILLAAGYFTYWRKALPRWASRFIMVLIILVVIAVVACFLVFAVSDAFRNFMLDTLRIPHEDSHSTMEILSSLSSSFADASNRDELRRLTIEHWKDNVVFGVSTKAAIVGFPADISDNSGSHNSFLQILATLGIIGFILFVGMYLSSLLFLLKAAFTSRDGALRTISIFSSAMLVTIAFDSNYENLLYLSLAMMVLAAYFLLMTGFQIANLTKRDR